MNVSIILAQILGIIFVVLGLSMLLNRKWTVGVVEEITRSQGIIWLAGLLTLMMGSVVVAFNNVWTSGLPLVITVVGWLMLIKGAVILILPGSAATYYRKVNKGPVFAWGGTIVLVLGVLLLFVR